MEFLQLFLYRNKTFFMLKYIQICISTSKIYPWEGNPNIHHSMKLNGDIKGAITNIHVPMTVYNTIWDSSVYSHWYVDVCNCILHIPITMTIGINYVYVYTPLAKCMHRNGIECEYTLTLCPFANYPRRTCAARVR